MNRSATTSINVHGTCVALTCVGRTTGVLLLGESGSGKSSLALNLIDQPGSGVGSAAPIVGHLVSDDQVLLAEVKGQLTASAPEATKGLLEVRGLGIVKAHTAVSPVRVELVVAHATTSEMDRMPEVQVIELAGLSLPLHKIDFSNPSAAAQIRTLAQVLWGLSSLINR